MIRKTLATAVAALAVGLTLLFTVTALSPAASEPGTGARVPTLAEHNALEQRVTTLDSAVDNLRARVADLEADSSPTPTPTPEPTPTPTPQPEPEPTPEPSEPPATGWPNAATTGVPAGTTLTAYTGPTTITTPGTVIDGKRFSGGVDIRATGVKITRSVFNGPVTVQQSGSLVLQDSEIRMPQAPGTGLEPYNWTALRVEITGGNRSAYCANNCVLRDSWTHGQFRDSTGRYHESGVRMEKNGQFIHNTLACDAPLVAPDAGCSAGLTGYGDFQAVTNNLIQGNYFVANDQMSACAYGGSSGGKPYSNGARDIRFIDNVFERGPSRQCGLYFPVTDFNASAPGNVFTGNKFVDGVAVRPNVKN